MFSQRPSAYLCALCVKELVQRRGRKDTQRPQRKLTILPDRAEAGVPQSFIKCGDVLGQELGAAGF